MLQVFPRAEGLATAGWESWGGQSRREIVAQIETTLQLDRQKADAFYDRMIERRPVGLWRTSEHNRDLNRACQFFPLNNPVYISIKAGVVARVTGHFIGLFAPVQRYYETAQFKV